ncbi:hypothetical protein ACNSOS_05125 [Aliarcobacter vitoriensis]|uniref:Nickel transport protein n=1 Tax=Aliarcobacter vitoriensis TaxID=2011099 RepID=A0A366MTL8_9BACT|nr:hypothetical protein [Aliarcobacter vitoriensis]RBQ28934.1 hypothetical protein CRU91_07090 [Aliarcobacter vitoriensis]RBQ31001.1 hypothetical protein CRU92_08815 [Arcobacter sp. FW59]
MNKIFKIAILLLSPLYIFAHSLVLYVDDNKDGTITIAGEFNTGESASGALVKLEALHSGEILFQQRLTDDDLIVDIPKIPYKVVLDGGGADHQEEKIGIAPPNGFEKVEQVAKPEAKKEQKPSRSLMQISSSPAVTISIFLAFLLLFATMLVSIINTNKILKKLEDNK